MPDVDLIAWAAAELQPSAFKIWALYRLCGMNTEDMSHYITRNTFAKHFLDVLDFCKKEAASRENSTDVKKF